MIVAARKFVCRSSPSRSRTPRPQPHLSGVEFKRRHWNVNIPQFLFTPLSTAIVGVARLPMLVLWYQIAHRISQQSCLHDDVNGSLSFFRSFLQKEAADERTASSLFALQTIGDLLHEYFKRFPLKIIKRKQLWSQLKKKIRNHIPLCVWEQKNHFEVRPVVNFFVGNTFGCLLKTLKVLFSWCVKVLEKFTAALIGPPMFYSRRKAQIRALIDGLFCFRRQEIPNIFVNL